MPLDGIGRGWLIYKRLLVACQGVVSSYSCCYFFSFLLLLLSFVLLCPLSLFLSD